MNDWNLISEKVAGILSERFHEIRKDISSDEILEKVTQSIALSGISMNLDGAEIDMSMVAELFQKYNDSHRKRILDLASSLGRVVDGNHVSDDNHVLIKVNDIFLELKKDLALRISILGFVHEES